MEYSFWISKWFRDIRVNEDLNGQEASFDVTIENTVFSVSAFCEGILGQPVVAVDFGSGSNPGPPLPSGTTTYTYSSNCALNIGEYIITNNSNSCRSLWHNIPQDHTGNPNGYFLMVNANDSRNEIYRTTIKNLNTSLKYEFSAWVGNLYNAVGAQNPNIRFEIYDLNGNPIASSGTIDIPVTIPVFQWQKVAFMFEIPPSFNSVQIVIVNTRRATDNQGNDMVIDDISFAPCLKGVQASFSNSSIVDKAHTCNNGTINLYSSWQTAIPFGNPAYQWQRSSDHGITWNSITNATTLNYVQTESLPGIFQYRIISYDISNPNQILNSNIITYYVQQIVVDSTTSNFFSCNGTIPGGSLVGNFHFLFSDPADTFSNIYFYNWSPNIYITNSFVNPTYIVLPLPPNGNGSSVPPSYYYYTFTVTNTNYGCTGSNIQTVSALRPRKVWVPNAFTPDGDGVNDTFYPINLEDYPGSIFRIFNRWGQEVFYSQGPTAASYRWNGKFQGIDQPADTYTWTVQMTGCTNYIYSAGLGDGYPYGIVNLIR